MDPMMKNYFIGILMLFMPFMTFGITPEEIAGLWGEQPSEYIEEEIKINKTSNLYKFDKDENITSIILAQDTKTEQNITLTIKMRITIDGKYFIDDDCLTISYDLSTVNPTLEDVDVEAIGVDNVEEKINKPEFIRLLTEVIKAQVLPQAKEQMQSMDPNVIWTNITLNDTYLFFTTDGKHITLYRHN